MLQRKGFGIGKNGIENHSPDAALELCVLAEFAKASLKKTGLLSADDVRAALGLDGLKTVCCIQNLQLKGMLKREANGYEFAEGNLVVVSSGKP